MNIVFRLIAMCVVFVILLKYNTFDRLMVTGEMRTYSAAIIASHDAAVPKIYDESRGYVVFDESNGADNFKQSLIKTLYLNSDLSPKAKSIFNSPIKIVGLFFQGDDKAPKDTNGQPKYPYEFQQNVLYRGKTITVRETIYGPSVLGLIEVAYKVEGNPISLKTAVYRYKDKALYY